MSTTAPTTDNATPTVTNPNPGRGNNTNETGGQGRGNGGRGGRGGARNRNRERGNTFKGLTEEMDGHVFQTYTETDKRVQFNKTVDMLGLYINNHLYLAEDMAPLYKELKMPTVRFELDEDDDDIPEEFKEEYNKMKVKAHLERKKTLKNNLRKVYAVIWGQCSEAMKASLKATTAYEERNLACDCVWLLKTI